MYVVTPIFYHAAHDSIWVQCAYLLVDFVDTYANFMIAFVAILAFLTLANTLYQSTHFKSLVSKVKKSFSAFHKGKTRLLFNKLRTFFTWSKFKK